MCEITVVFFVVCFILECFPDWIEKTGPSRTYPVGRTVHCRESWLSSPLCAEWILQCNGTCHPCETAQAVPMTLEGHREHPGERSHPGPFQLPCENRGTRKRKFESFHLNSDNFLHKNVFLFQKLCESQQCESRREACSSTTAGCYYLCSAKALQNTGEGSASVLDAGGWTRLSTDLYFPKIYRWRPITRIF